MVLAVDRAGLVGDDGETHQGIYDVAYLGSIPGITIYAPATNAELKALLYRALYQTEGVAAIRYPRGSDPGLEEEFSPEPKADWHLQETGAEILAISYGRTAVALYEALIRKISGYRRIVMFEEAEQSGSIAERICLRLMASGFCGSFRAVTLPDSFIPQGKVAELLKIYHLDAESMKKILGEEEHALWQKQD